MKGQKNEEATVVETSENTLKELIVNTFANALMCVLIAVMVCWFMKDTREQDEEKIGVISQLQITSDILEHYKGGNAELAMKVVTDKISLLREDGWLLLKAENIIHAPEKYVIRTEDLFGGLYPTIEELKKQNQDGYDKH